MKTTIASIVLALLFIGGAFVLSQSTPTEDVPIENNVSIVDGVQIVEIRAKGGYFPRRSVAQAGVPTVVRFITNGTFDCSAAVRIPSVDVGEYLPHTGTTEVVVGTHDASVLEGMCGMAMYFFEIEFQA